MDLIDFLVFFAYIIIFHFIFKARRKRLADPALRSYHAIGFWVKVFSCFAYCIFVLYISRGDTTALYYPEGWNFYNLILKDSANNYLLFISPEEFDQTLLFDPWNMGYLMSPSNYMVVRIVAILSFLTLGKFMAINLIFAMIAFSGAWKLFMFFYEQYPRMHKGFALSILFLPSYVFWSSGILKDPLCTAAMGWLTYSFYHLFYDKKNVFKDFLIVMISCYTLIVLKVYILVSYLPFLFLFILLKNLSLIKNKLIKLAVIPIFMAGSFFGFLAMTENAEIALGSFASKGLTTSISNYQKNFTNQQDDETSTFSLGVEFDGSAGSLLRIAPMAIIATLYRPFIWETKKISTVMSSIESLLLMFFTLYVVYKSGVINTLKTIVNNPLVLTCILFSLTFSLFVGATTLNFGSLVRYKIPGTPFYVIALFIILYLNAKPPKSSKKNVVVLSS